MKRIPLGVDFLKRDGTRTTKNFYEFLEIPENASAEDIKKAYRKKAFDWHPDRNPGDRMKEDCFKVLQNVYEIFKDPAKKQIYDAELARSRRPVPKDPDIDMEVLFEYVFRKWGTGSYTGGTTTASNSNFWD